LNKVRTSHVSCTWTWDGGSRSSRVYSPISVMHPESDWDHFEGRATSVIQGAPRPIPPEKFFNDSFVTKLCSLWRSIGRLDVLATDDWVKDDWATGLLSDRTIGRQKRRLGEQWREPGHPDIWCMQSTNYMPLINIFKRTCNFKTGLTIIYSVSHRACLLQLVSRGTNDYQ